MGWKICQFLMIRALLIEFEEQGVCINSDINQVNIEDDLADMKHLSQVWWFERPPSHQNYNEDAERVRDNWQHVDLLTIVLILIVITHLVGILQETQHCDEHSNMRQLWSAQGQVGIHERILINHDCFGVFSLKIQKYLFYFKNKTFFLLKNIIIKFLTKLS